MFWRVDLQNRGQLGSRVTYVYVNIQMYITGGCLSSQARCVAGQHLFFVAKGFSSFQGATTTLNLRKDSALNFWQLFGESLSMNLASIVVDVFFH